LLIRSDDNQKALTAAFVELQKDTHSSYQGVEMVGDDALIKLRVPEKADPAIVESKFDSLYQAKVEQIQEDNLQNSEPQNYSPLSVMEYTIKLAKILADMSSGVPIHIVGDVISSTINQGNIIKVTLVMMLPIQLHQLILMVERLFQVM
jgi:hypothetical protein